MVLARHPPVHAAGLCYGRTDLPVADRAAIEALATELRRFGGIIWTSPSRRCRDVARAVGPHNVDPRLQELDFGAWENQPWDAVPRAALDCWADDPWHFAPPGGESGAALVARVGSFHAALPNGSHVVITHGGPLKVLAALLRGHPVDLLAPPPPPGSFACYTITASPAIGGL